MMILEFIISMIAFFVGGCICGWLSCDDFRRAWQEKYVSERDDKLVAEEYRRETEDCLREIYRALKKGERFQLFGNVFNEHLEKTKAET